MMKRAAWIAVGVVIALIAVPVGVRAAGNLVTIVDPSATTAAGGAKVAGGKLEVGDGSGALTVDGSVRPLAPTTNWFATEDVPSVPGRKALVGPTTAPIDVTSISVSLLAGGTGEANVLLWGGHTATTSCSPPDFVFDRNLWHIPQVTGAFSVAFPTPLQWRPPAGTKACLLAANVGGQDFTINASGFIGG